MGEIHGRITYSAEDIQRIKAASFHDHVPVKAETPVQPTIEIEHHKRVDYGKDMLVGKNTDGLLIRLEVSTNINAACFLNHYGDRSETIWADDIDLWIALLTRARELMGGK
jgi:hypothetical protein